MTGFRLIGCGSSPDLREKVLFVLVGIDVQLFGSGCIMDGIMS